MSSGGGGVTSAALALKHRGRRQRRRSYSFDGAPMILAEETEFSTLEVDDGGQKQALRNGLAHVARVNFAVGAGERHSAFRMEADAVPPLPAAAESTEILKLNVGGSSFFLTTSSVLHRLNNSFLTRFADLGHEDRLLRCAAYFPASGEYFFERSGRFFEFIHRFYAGGKLHAPGPDSCFDEFLDELRYWQIPTESLASCCLNRMEDDSGESPEPSSHHSVEIYSAVCMGDLRFNIWNLIEEPSSSRSARIFAGVSVFFVLLASVGLVLGSIDELQVPVVLAEPIFNASGDSLADDLARTAILSDLRKPHPILEAVEYLCIVWFTAEYLVKVLVSAHRWRTCFTATCIIDLIAILPFYIELVLIWAGLKSEEVNSMTGAFLVVRIVRVLRVVRIFKLGRYSAGMRTFALTMKASFRHLCMMGIVLLTGVVFFSTVVYFLEKDVPGTRFYSIPAGFWWAMVTMTTVGYGDVVPITVGGKLVGSAAIACGVLVLALPITIIVDNFMKVSTVERPSTFIAHPYLRKASMHYSQHQRANRRHQTAL